MATSQPLIQIAHLSQSFDGQRQVLRNINVSVAAGAFVTLVGPSGAGKSTLLRLIAGLITPTAGQVLVAGEPPHLAPDPIGVVFQQHNLMPWRTAYDNVRLPLELQSFSRAQSHDRVMEVLALVGLRGFEESYPAQLSGGMAQRVALARALVMQPRVLLLDEPTANLDPYNVGLIETIVREENAARGITVVLVTHNIFQARRVAHRTALLLRGEVVEVGETSAFFARPTQAQTAAFLRGDLVY